ncbi:MAG: hypothetical protein AAGE52_06650 [Myxococcota bacterium]
MVWRLALVFVLGVAAPTFAQESRSEMRLAEPEPDAPPTPGRRVGGTLLALGPGFLVSGVGHWTIQRPVEARRLLAAKGIGFASLVAGGAILGLTGASRRTVGVGASLALRGAGPFFLSWLADVYGAASAGLAKSGPALNATYELGLAYRYVRDPIFDYANFLAADAHLRLGRLRVSPSIASALDDNNQRMRVETGVRAVGDPRSRGTSLDVVSAVTWHRFAGDGFQSVTMEASLNGRLNLRALGPSLQGSFAELSLGFALQLFDYDAVDSGFGDGNGMLLGRAAFGMYLGRAPRSGELRFYYDHRKDGYVAGIGLGGAGAGVAGFVGADLTQWITERWGVHADLQLGSAHMITVGLRYRPNSGRIDPGSRR